MPTTDGIDSASLEFKTVAPAAFVVPAGAAGTQVEISLPHTNIRSLTGNTLGTKDDTSLVIVGTAFLREVSEYNYHLFAINGDYYVDYSAGMIFLKKADASVACTIGFIFAIAEGSLETSAVTINASIDKATTGDVGKVAVTSAATLIKASNVNRTVLTVVNEGANPVRIGFDATVTYNGTAATDGILLQVNQGTEINNTSAVYAICAAALTATLSFSEETF